MSSSGQIATEEGDGYLSANKVLAIILWNERSIIYIDYLHKERTMNDESYGNLLDRFKDNVSSSTKIM